MLKRIIDIGRNGANGARHSLGCSMQQECPSASIMTSHPPRKVRAFFSTLALAAILGAAGCAAAPEDAAVMERLDSETGVPVSRMGRPVELYRDTFLQEAAGRFAFIAPFETNQMGTREDFLWVALPIT